MTIVTKDDLLAAIKRLAVIPVARLILIGRKISFAVIEIWASISIVVQKEILVKHRRR